MRQRLTYSAALSGALAACLVLASCGEGDAGKATRSDAAAQAGAPATPTTFALPDRASPASPSAATAPVEVAAAPQSPNAPAASGLAPTDGSLYVCVIGTASAQQRTPVELSPSVDKLCRKAPEMGPCQYEREVCRRQGGRVYTASGVEITKQVEAEYDRRVMRIRMKSN